jgi:hypothetical protein
MAGREIDIGLGMTMELNDDGNNSANSQNYKRN